MGFLSKVGKTLSKVGKTLTGAAKTIAPIVLGAGGGSLVGSPAGAALIPAGGAAPVSIFEPIGKVLAGASKIGATLSETGCALGGCKSVSTPILGVTQGGAAAAPAAPAGLGLGGLLAIGAALAIFSGAFKK